MSRLDIHENMDLWKVKFPLYTTFATSLSYCLTKYMKTTTRVRPLMNSGSFWDPIERVFP